MELSKFESNPGKQTMLSLTSIAVGVVLVFAFRNFNGPGMTNSLAGFLLGLLLLIIGIAAFLANGKQTIVIDPKSRSIIVEDTNRFGTKKRLIQFSEIVHAGIGYLGKKSNYTTFYYIILKLRSGEEYSLFAPGRFFEGGLDRTVMESRRQDIERYLKQ